jgi:uncharacterized oligopeptide transporter (OPT) family protein
VNLMTANITAGATSAAGDLLTDLKSGYCWAPTRASSSGRSSPA